MSCGFYLSLCQGRFLFYIMSGKVVTKFVKIQANVENENSIREALKKKQYFLFFLLKPPKDFLFFLRKKRETPLVKKNYFLFLFEGFPNHIMTG